MKSTVGSYRIIYGYDITAVVPLGKRCKVKEPVVYPNENLPKYIQREIAFRLHFIGLCYLVHADNKIGNPKKPTGQAQHYLGFAKNIELRMLRHLNGNGAAIMRAFAERGIPTHVVRIWVGDRYFERKLKRQHNRVRLCPTCKGG